MGRGFHPLATSDRHSHAPASATATPTAIGCGLGLPHPLRRAGRRPRRGVPACRRRLPRAARQAQQPCGSKGPFAAILCRASLGPEGTHSFQYTAPPEARLECDGFFASGGAEMDQEWAKMDRNRFAWLKFGTIIFCIILLYYILFIFALFYLFAAFLGDPTVLIPWYPVRLSVRPSSTWGLPWNGGG